MKQVPIIVGRSEAVDFPERGVSAVAARIDTGAKTSSIWATKIREHDGQLEFCLFGPKSDYYDASAIVRTTQFETRVVASSNGQAQERYVIKLLISLKGRRIRASFTLANRSSQAYPVLVGRNVLRGKFLVDVSRGEPAATDEKSRSRQLQSSKSRKEAS